MSAASAPAVDQVALPGLRGPSAEPTRTYGLSTGATAAWLVVRPTGPSSREVFFRLSETLVERLRAVMRNDSGPPTRSAERGDRPE